MIDIPSDGSAIEIKADNIYGVYNALNTLSFLIQYIHSENTYVLRHAPIHIDDTPFLKVFDE